ncbi:uncharacterized protein V1513DRAFT_444721 [Lipomyces chichibuensis]|uniref:uncharacterized protein n=1 Tax=Lipomyces chichibuensis TaxID=1546026 RepID=UPI003343D623
MPRSKRGTHVLPSRRNQPPSAPPKQAPSNNRSRNRNKRRKLHDSSKRTDDYDPLAKRDEDYILYFAKKLGIKSGRLPKSDDGLDDLTEGLDLNFLDDLLGLEKKGKVRGKFRTASIEEKIEKGDGDDLDGYLDLEDDDESINSDFIDRISADEDEDLELDEEEEDEENEVVLEDGEERDIDDGEEEFKGFIDEVNNNPTDKDMGEAESEKKEAPKRENPYLPPVAAASSGKYIPPSLRKKQLEISTNESEEKIKLRRQCQSLVNRLSEANIASIVNEFQQMFLNNSRQSMSSIITSIVLDMTAQRAVILDNFVVAYGALIAALYKNNGVDFGAYFIQTLVENFDKHYCEAEQGKECTNLIVLLSQLYTFQVVGCALIYDFIRLFLRDITELHTELLLKLIQNSGSQLRHDDPASLKDIITMLHQAVQNIPSVNLNPRTQFLIETVSSWKNNRLKQTSHITSESITRMRKYLGNIPKIMEPLRVTLDDIRNVETKGKWWLVGAAWSGDNALTKTTDLDVDVAAVKDILDTAEPDWLALARQQRMNTDVRRAIFVAIMGSEDYVDANDRLMKLKLKRAQEREIPRVILHCCGNEKDFNPFYVYVASLLCKNHAMKKAFQFSLWEFLKQLDGSLDDEESGHKSDEDNHDIRFMGRAEEDDEKTKARKINNYAKFYSALVGEGGMTLDIFKSVNFLTCTEELQEFLVICFSSLFSHIRVRSSRQKDRLAGEKALIQLVIKVKNNAVLLKGVEYFLKARLKTLTKKSASKKTSDTIKWGADIISDSIKRLSASDL